MTSPESRRGPRVFDPDDPGVETASPEATLDRDALGESALDGEALPEGTAPARIPTAADLERGLGWGAVLVSSIAGLMAMSAGIWIWNFVSGLLVRQDWIGWTAVALAGLAGLAAAMLIGGEIVGIFRLRRLRRLRNDAEDALAEGDAKAAREAARQIAALQRGREEVAWALARYRRHEADVTDARERLALLDRELMVPVDQMARRLVARSAKNVSMVTTISPAALVDVGYVLFENLRMMRRIAALYGGRPGLVGLYRLSRLVLGHMILTGGLALTDDFLPQALGQGLAARLSFRFGQGLFNGSLTARIGCAAIEVSRPLPFIEARPPRYRDLAKEVAGSLITRETPPKGGR
ncbi:MAG: TIGR01620 family protein [Hyphomicrobiaceae bacterium]